MKMPFGKFKGYEVEEIELQYLLWLEGHVPLRGPIRVAVAQEIEFRRGLEVAVPDQDKVKRIYHELSFKWHPDRIGGNTQAMQAINEFYQQLKDKP